MERRYKHKNSGSLMVYKDGCMKIDNLVIEGHPNMEYWEEIELYVKKSKPVLTTADGVDIYEGESYWFIWLNDSTCIKNNQAFTPYYITNIKKLSGETTFSEDARFFSTKIAAEAYILFNKPCLSLNDVFKVYPQFKKMENSILTKHAEELINLVKK